MMNDKEITQAIAKQLNIAVSRIESVIHMHEEGNTIPFMARYRKEMTSGLDEVQLRDILQAYEYLQNLAQRKEEVIRLVDEQGKLTEELQAAIFSANKLQQVEDLYRPYKQKRRTRASIAKEKGLAPLADWLFSCPANANALEYAEKFISEAVPSAEEALEGAKDIIAELISDNATLREWIRNETMKKGIIKTEAKNEKKDEDNVYEMYYTYEEPLSKIVPHRTLAINRGEAEEILRVAIEVPVEQILTYINRNMIQNEKSAVVPLLLETITDSYKRLISPAIEREVRNELTVKAEERAIHIFAENVRKLFLQPPLKGKTVLGVDPAYRTGCKLAVVDETGKLLHVDVIYPHPPRNKKEEAYKKVVELLNRYNVELIAIGNGTASRETEQFIADTIQETSLPIAYLIVNEAGASVYSASDLARSEFPNLQVEERSAISIARRLQDPLAELVKIDPKSVGVGQYQHDVSQKQLNESLQFTVETVVNQVGVNVNTASSALLQYVSGLSKTVAENIVKQREESGKFTSRTELKKIPRLGAKTYEQAIGFLRIIDGKKPLDRTPIHPEHYAETEKLLKYLHTSTADIGSETMKQSLESITIEEMTTKLDIGKWTLQDIIESLIRPERDPRDEIATPLLKKNILQLEDLTKGMELEGTVRNVVDFGAFVDIGVKQDGLIHISKLSRTFVKHPLDVVSVGDIVTVWIEDVDVNKKRIALTKLVPK